MALRVTTATLNGILDTGFDAMFNSGILQLRTGTQPANASAAVTGTLLWSETLPADAFAAAALSAKQKNGTWQGLGLAAGAAAWFRLKQAGDTNAVTNNEPRIDGLVTGPGGGGELTINNVNIAVSQSVEVLTCAVALIA